MVWSLKKQTVWTVVGRCKLHWLHFSITQQQTKHADHNNCGGLGGPPATPTHWGPQASHQQSTEDWCLRVMGRGQLLCPDTYRWAWVISPLHLQYIDLRIWKYLISQFYLAMILNEFLLDVLSTEIFWVTNDSCSSYTSQPLHCGKGWLIPKDSRYIMGYVKITIVHSGWTMI